MTKAHHSSLSWKRHCSKHRPSQRTVVRSLCCRWGWRAAQLAMITASAVAPICLSISFPAHAAINTGPGQTRLEQGATGTAPFDANDNPGNDANATNNIVRTFDTVAYDVIYVINGASDDVIVEVTLASDRQDGQSGQVWTELPGLCGGPSSAISGDILICDLGDIVEPNGGSITGRLTVVAQVTPDTPHGL